MSLGVEAQIVTIPNANFKNYLLSNSSINTNSDTEIQVSEAMAVTRLSVHGKSINDLTGIEAFTNLTFLECDTNQLTSLDVHLNTLLDTLNCNNNQIPSLDVSMLPLLKRLNCASNQLTTFDASMNTAMIWFDIGNNKITTLDLSNNTALTLLDIVYCTFLTSVNLSQNINLNTLLALQTTQLLTLDVSLNTALTSLNVTNIFGASAAKTICVNASQMASHAGWSKKANDVYSTTNCLVGIDELPSSSASKKLLHIYNMLGQEVNINEVSEGVFFYQYSDGSIKKVANF